MADDSKRVPVEKALKIADELTALLSPFCDRVEIAGSCRRRKPSVKDIELVVIPKLFEEEVAVDFFATEQRIRCPLDDFILNDKRFELRLNKLGHAAYGDKNKLLVYKGMPLDIFTADASNWVMVKFIRTGGAENNTMTATLALKKGYELKQYSCGFRNRTTGTIVRTESEEAIYAFLGVPFIPPTERK